MSIIGDVTFAITAFFYFMSCCLEPGYVIPEFDIIVNFK